MLAPRQLEVRMARFGGALAVVFLFSAPLAAQDSWFWSVPGSSGVTDDESTWAIALNDTGSASIRSSASNATVKLRYAVTGGPAQLTGFDAAMCLRLSVRDTG